MIRSNPGASVLAKVFCANRDEKKNLRRANEKKNRLASFHTARTNRNADGVK